MTSLFASLFDCYYCTVDRRGSDRAEHPSVCLLKLYFQCFTVWINKGFIFSFHLRQVKTTLMLLPPVTWGLLFPAVFAAAHTWWSGGRRHHGGVYGPERAVSPGQERPAQRRRDGGSPWVSAAADNALCAGLPLLSPGDVTLLGPEAAALKMTVFWMESGGKLCACSLSCCWNFTYRTSSGQISQRASKKFSTRLHLKNCHFKVSPRFAEM